MANGKMITRRGVFQRAIAEDRGYQRGYWGPEYGRVAQEPQYMPVPQAFVQNPLAFAPLSAGRPIRSSATSAKPIGSVESAASQSAQNISRMYGDELYGRGQGIFESQALPCTTENEQWVPQRGGIFEASTLHEACIYDGATGGKKVMAPMNPNARRLENQADYAGHGVPMTTRAIGRADGLWGRR